ncbi:MAG: 3-dehydroquinate synthase [Candidatus Wallbacteria bacterium]|nr:3-dehydroquinate synthase [Candidatus Wallbacteria bacterium]
MPGNIILTGFFGSGKKTIGRILAEKCGFSFLSTDLFMELEERAILGDAFFPGEEILYHPCSLELAEKISPLSGTVIAWGSRAPFDEEYRKLFSKSDRIVYLHVDHDIFLDRVEHRLLPLEWDRQKLSDLYQELSESHVQADHTCDTSMREAGQAAEEIASALNLPRASEETYSEDIKTDASGKHVIQVGNKLSSFLSDRVKELAPRKVAIISNPLVASLFFNKIAGLCGETEIQAFCVPDGEEFKTLSTAERIYGFLLTEGYSRSDLLIALGGGVIGDLCGFVASTYKRGMPVIQIPTTLLAQVDSAIGGKTGINHSRGKNMIGTFYQPEMVISSTAFLQCLPEREFRNGLAEVIKYAIIRDHKLFSFLADRKSDILARKPETLQQIVSCCSKIKTCIVSKDEREELGIREVLNFGHTVGHMIETLTGYTRYRHGEAVAIGMAVEAQICRDKGFLKKKDCEKILTLISDYSLPVSIPEDIDSTRFKEMLTQDKKVRQDMIRLPVPEKIGRAEVKEVECGKFL